MTMPESVVAPPVETPALFGLFSAARLLPLSGHDEFGVQYEALCDNSVRVWPGACRTIAAPDQITRTVTLAYTGARTGAEPDYAYTVSVAATVDGGPARTLTATVADHSTAVTTGAAATVVFIGTQPGPRSLVVVDDLTGIAFADTITQNADGTLSADDGVFVVLDGDRPEKLPSGATERVVATPFGVYGVENCLMGLSAQEITERARQRLGLIEQPSVERAFWTGEYGNTPALATGTPEIVGDPATPVDLASGLSLLEQWLGQETGSVGFIHVNRGAAAIAAELGLIERNSSRAETKIGNIWVFGGGYPRTGPSGQAAPIGRQMWMFASRQPTVRRTEVFVPGDVDSGTALNWAKNSAFVVAERVFVVDFPCHAAAVKIDLAKCRCGGGA